MKCLRESNKSGESNLAGRVHRQPPLSRLPVPIETVPMHGKISGNFALLQNSVAVFFSQAPIPSPALIPDMENQGQVVAKCQLKKTATEFWRSAKFPEIF